MPGQPDETTRPASSYLRFDGMTWPNPADPTEIQWQLRYGEPTRETLVAAASVLAAYAHLIAMPRRTREQRIRQIREAMRQFEGGDEHA